MNRNFIHQFRQNRKKAAWFRWRSKQSQAGLTLIELIVASVIVSVVMLIAWSGLISLMNMSAQAEARSLRQIEVNRAVDFIADELRSARFVNATETSQVDGATTIADVLTADGFDLNDLGGYGDLALYLEIPGLQDPPGSCPANGPNAGQPPPTPSTFDRVIYDIRASSSEWLGPRTLTRYGRLKDADGSFNPCDSPIMGDPIADALTDDASAPPACSGTLTGGAGFFACKEGEHTFFTFQHTLVDTSIEDVIGGATSRVQSIQPESPILGCHDEGTLRSLNSDTPQAVTFVSQTPTEKRIYWLDDSGTRQLRTTLTGTDSFSWNSYLTHPWVITNNSDECQAIFMPYQSDQPNVFRLDHEFNGTSVGGGPVGGVSNETSEDYEDEDDY